MKDRLRVAQAAVLGKLRAALAAAGAHRFWVESATITLLGLLAAAAYGTAAISRTSALRARADDLRVVERGIDRWRGEIQPALAAESLAWRESEATLRALGGEATRPLTLARLVAQRAEEAGIDELHVSVLPADSVTALTPVAAGGWSLVGEREGLVVEFEGDLTDVVGFLGALPPQAVVSALTVSPVEERLRARVSLVTRSAAPGS